MGQKPASATAEAPLSEEYYTGRVIRLAAVAAIGGFLFGFDSAVINGATDALKSKFGLGDDLFNFSGDGPFVGIGIVVAIALLGSAVGAWFSGSMANKWGRKTVMVIGAVMFFIAAIGQAFPFSEYELMLWRFVGGVGIGLASVIAPMYIAEISPAALRGRLGSMQQLAIVIGIFTTAVTNFIILTLAQNNGTPTEGAVKANGDIIFARNEWLLGLEAWQWMFLIMVIPAIVYGVLALTIPESPRYLVYRGKNAQAKKVLESVFKGDQTARLATIDASLEGSSRPKFADLRGMSMGLHPLVWVGIGLAVFQQFVGINVIFYYSNIIWQAAGFEESQAFLITLITNTTNVVVTVVAIALVDKVGRRPLLLVGSVGMTVSLAVLAIVFGTAPVDAAGDPVLATGAGYVAVVAANLYVVFFGVSWGPVVWVLLGEMFPNKIRAMAMSVAVMFNWLANFVVTVTFPTLSQISLALAYGIFTAMAFISFFFVLKWVKETKGVTLEDMQLAMSEDENKTPEPS